MSTTLAEELEEAADLAEAAGRKTGTLDAVVEGNLLAARWRARAARVREVEAEFTSVERFKYDVGYQDALRKLAGPDLPSPPREAGEAAADWRDLPGAEKWDRRREAGEAGGEKLVPNPASPSRRTEET